MPTDVDSSANVVRIADAADSGHSSKRDTPLPIRRQTTRRTTSDCAGPFVDANPRSLRRQRPELLSSDLLQTHFIG